MSKVNFWWLLAQVLVGLLALFLKNQHFKEGWDAALAKSSADTRKDIERAKEAGRAHDAFVDGDPDRLRDDPNRRLD